ncbi:hypothetical protein [Lactobacillus xylocopicola]|uniref:Uncharacterized protein n=1 Tax=Lactobacillus xylocopicola TaxID=2976676 RepID=A0ABM8BGC9_9LACO|nr:hypothetical protein [Lactobacillus xylocopicola]BDR60272.1 hypothetical protein KIM322_05330 [Lactobacillus xylocopicola]
MKRQKIITLLAAATITLTTVSGVAVNDGQQVQAAAKGNKYGFIKLYTFPKSYRGTWYNTSFLSGSPITIRKTSFGASIIGNHINGYKVGKVKGTNKYPWQMSTSWQDANSDIFNKNARITEKTMHGSKWIVIGMVNKKAQNFAFTVKTEVLNGKKQTVLFRANASNGLVTHQYFSSQALAQKYGQHQFKNVTYQ